jgi:UDP-N-acetylmuramyl pentapeptide synthase/D-alanine-D-alanine ligase-like ATP-grasp enzyme/acylphosphatase
VGFFLVLLRIPMMSLSSLFASARQLVAARFSEATALSLGHPACILFFSLSDGVSRAHICRGAGSDFSHAWQDGVRRCQLEAVRRKLVVRWLRIDRVTAVEDLTWGELSNRLTRTKRNYFRFGLALDAELKYAFLETEIGAHAMLYLGSEKAEAGLNEKNFTIHARQRFGQKLALNFSPNAPVYLFAHEGAFFSDDPMLDALPDRKQENQSVLWLPGPKDTRANWHACLNNSRRQLTTLKADEVFALIRSGANFLARQVQESGQFTYGHFPCFGRTIPSYNALRHASSIYSMLEAWELTRDESLLAAIRRALEYLIHTLIRRYPLTDGRTLAFNVDINGEIKLGANAVSLLALVKYDELTGDIRHRLLLEQLALGISHMQNTETGKFVHVLDADNLSVKEAFRIIYYDGEAAFGLMRLYGLTRDSRWLAIVERAFDYFIQADHWRHHDHWLSYCANELTLYKPEEKYFRFAVQNIASYLDFILRRETTYPTLLELSMAFEAMLQRIESDHPHMRHLLAGLDIDKFQHALHHRAHTQLNGFFWPELAMYFAKPQTVLGSFFIRHHSFRVRIDDIEHYLSGYVAYWRMLKATESRQVTGRANDPPSQLKPAGPIIVWGGDVNLGRRQHYRTAELGLENILRIPALQAADLRIVNLECVIATQGIQGVSKGESGPYYYRARPEMLGILAAAGIDMVATANNHSGDYGPSALLEQGRWLDAFGIAHAGSGVHREAAFSPVIRRAGNVNVALFSIDATQPRFAAAAEAAGSAHLPLNDAAIWKSELTPRIAAARQQAHVVLLAVHWGDNLANAPSPAAVAVGHALIEAGADAVLGASAHLLQGIEIYQGRPILYDAGDLLFDSVRSTPGRGGVFHLEVSEHGVERLIFVPVGIGFGFSEQLTGQTAYESSQNFARKCAELGCKMQVIRDGRAYIDLSPARRMIRALAPAPVTQYNASVLNVPSARNSKVCQVHEVPADARLEHPVSLGPLTLLGIRVTPTEISRRQMLWVESYWRCAAPVDEDIRLDIRGVPVKPTKMRPWGTGMDHDPCDWMAPTSRWLPGVIYRDYHGLRPPYLTDWENIDLRLTAGIISRQYANVAPVPLQHVIHLAVPGKDQIASTQVAPTYKTDFPQIIHDCKPRQTWSAEQLQAITGGKWLVRPPEGWYVRSVAVGFKHICMLPPPVLFVGHDSFDRARHEQIKLPSKNFDRHHVIAKNTLGLAGAMIRDAEVVPLLPADFPVLQVNDPIQSLIELGIAARQRYKCDVFAVTGTAGKSTTTGMLQTMLGGADRVLASIDNYNSRVGALAMLANLTPDYEAAVIEIAQSALWMKRGPITRLVKPTVSLITEIGMSQTDTRVNSIEDTAKWKSRIFDGLTGPAIAVLGEHLPCFDYVIAEAHKHAKRVVVFGRSDAAEVRVLDVELDAEGSWISLRLPTEQVRFRVPLPGPGMANNAIAAITAVYASERDIAQAIQQLQAFQASEGRVQRHTLRFGSKAVQLIDDSFNATATSMLNAFSVFELTPVAAGRRKIAVLGRIVHLGDLAKPLHEGLANPLLASGAALVITHGEEMRYLRAVLPQNILGPHFSSSAPLVDYLRSQLHDGDLVMVKGSRRDSDFGNVISLLKSSFSPSNADILKTIYSQNQNDFSTSIFHKYGIARLGRGIISEYAESVGISIREERGYRFYATKLPDGRREIFEQNNPGESVFCHYIQLSKQYTKQLLEMRGFPVPAGKIFSDKLKAEAYFRNQTNPQVIKPDDAEGGAGVSVNVTSTTEFGSAWIKAQLISKKVIVEDFCDGDDVRVLVVGMKAVAAMSRMPAFVVGDGRLTVDELIEQKNRQRRKNPRLKWSPIKDTSFLSELGFDRSYTPTEGEFVRLGGTFNVSQGGEYVSIMEKLNPAILKMVEGAAGHIHGATLLGFDLLVKEFAGLPTHNNVKILEVNSNPSISSAYFASYGPPASLIPKLLLDLVIGGDYPTAPSKVETAAIVPAMPYIAFCDGNSFQRNYSVQMSLLRQAAYARNLIVDVVNSHATQLKFGGESVSFFQGMCSRTRVVARRATNNKEWTKELLSQAGIPAPCGASFASDQIESAWQFLASIGLPGVVKPIAGSGGKGISTEIFTREHFEQAWGIACATGAKKVMVEEHVEGNDYRVFVIGAITRAVVQRIPAHLIGDGIHTVAELLRLKNVARSSNPYSGSKPTALTPMIQLNLARQGLDESTVIEKDRFLQLHTVANIGSGGDSRDVTDRVHPDWAPIAAKVRESVYEPVHVGFDLIAEDVSKPPSSQRWCVIEVNCNPDFGLHHFPSEGVPRDLSGALIEHLFPDCCSEKSKVTSLQVSISGKVQGVGYRNWLWRRAHLHAVHGWVRNLSDGRVEAVFSGTSSGVKALLEACHRGPNRSEVKTIATKTYLRDVPHGFRVLIEKDAA